MHANEQDAPSHMGKTAVTSINLAFVNVLFLNDKSGWQLFPYDVKAVWIHVEEIQSSSMTATGGVVLHPCTEVTGQRLQEVK